MILFQVSELLSLLSFTYIYVYIQLDISEYDV